jgi:hypothetical protein
MAIVAEAGPASRLVAWWTELGARVGPGCPAGVLDAFEARTGRVLPADLRAFLAAANGAEVDDGFYFLPLEAYEPFDQVAERDGQGWPSVADAGAYYVFCDYLQWSWRYAIRLRRPGDAEGGNDVVPVGMNQMFVVAGSFSEFMDLYQADADRLYPPD